VSLAGSIPDKRLPFDRLFKEFSNNLPLLMIILKLDFDATLQKILGIFQEYIGVLLQVAIAGKY